MIEQHQFFSKKKTHYVYDYIPPSHVKFKKFANLKPVVALYDGL